MLPFWAVALIAAVLLYLLALLVWKGCKWERGVEILLFPQIVLVTLVFSPFILLFLLLSIPKGNRSRKASAARRGGATAAAGSNACGTAGDQETA